MSAPLHSTGAMHHLELTFRGDSQKPVPHSQTSTQGSAKDRGELGHLTRPAGNVSQLRALVARGRGVWGRLLLAGLGGAGGFPEYTQQSGKAAPFCEQALRYEARTFTTGWEADRQLSSHNLLEEGG